MTEDRQRVGLTEGTIVDGRYRVESELGRGGFARVYRAAHTDLERGAALKVIELPERPGAVDLFIERFLREARIAANLSHPNVVTVYDYGVVEQTGQPFLAMELLEGWDLDMVLAHRGPIEPPRAVRLMIEVLDALAQAQAKGIVHKDLKPSNLFVVGEGTLRERLVLIDFGIARIWDDEDSRITQTGGFTGTPAYFAPEYVEHQIVTPAIDVYQSALILVEMMTGVPAVVAENSMQYLLKHCSGEVDIPPELSEGPLGEVLTRALAVNHEDRWPDCGAFRDALAGVDADAIVPPRRSGAGGPVVRHNTLETPPQTDEFGDSMVSGDTLAAPNNLRSAPTHAETTPETPSAIATATPAPSKTPWIIAGIAVLALLIGAVMFAQRPPPAPAPVIEATPVVPTKPAPVVAPTIQAEQVKPPAVAPEPFRITTKPVNAVVVIDGVHHGLTPVTLGEKYLDGEPHKVVIKAEGYARRQADVVFKPGQSVLLELKPLKRPNARRGVRQRQRRQEIVAPTRPAEPAEAPPTELIAQ